MNGSVVRYVGVQRSGNNDQNNSQRHGREVGKNIYATRVPENSR